MFVDSPATFMSDSSTPNDVTDFQISICAREFDSSNTDTAYCPLGSTILPSNSNFPRVFLDFGEGAETLAGPYPNFGTVDNIIQGIGLIVGIGGTRNGALVILGTRLIRRHAVDVGGSDATGFTQIDGVGFFNVIVGVECLPGYSGIDCNTFGATTLATTTQQPTTEQPTTEQPTTEQPTTERPTTVQPTTEQPTDAEQPTTEQPTTEQPTTEQPTTEQPTTEQPTTGQPTTEELTTEQPTTDQTTELATSQDLMIATTEKPTSNGRKNYYLSLLLSHAVPLTIFMGLNPGGGSNIGLTAGAAAGGGLVLLVVLLIVIVLAIIVVKSRKRRKGHHASKKGTDPMSYSLFWICSISPPPPPPPICPNPMGKHSRVD